MMSPLKPSLSVMGVLISSVRMHQKLPERNCVSSVTVRIFSLPLSRSTCICSLPEVPAFNKIFLPLLYRKICALCPRFKAAAIFWDYWRSWILINNQKWAQTWSVTGCNRLDTFITMILPLTGTIPMLPSFI